MKKCPDCGNKSLASLDELWGSMNIFDKVFYVIGILMVKLALKNKTPGQRELTGSN